MAPPTDGSAHEIILDDTTDRASTPPATAGARLGVPVRATSAASATKPSCNPPYIEDATGIRRVKRECL
jgi:hypothetical protein